MIYIIDKNLEDINENDLLHLVENHIIEKKTLEYKGQQIGNADDDKKKFLSTISSFANSSGGDLIIGIKEDRNSGAPQSPLEGLLISNVDQEILRLEQIIRDGIEPNIPNSCINSKKIVLTNGNIVIIIRILKSWLEPHRISFKKWHKFYARSTNGKYLLDIQELRSAFILSETITENIRNFKQGRLSLIISGETPIPLNKKAKLIVHLIPVNSFKLGNLHEIELINRRAMVFKPMFAHNWDIKRYNLDGIIAYKQTNNENESYIQLFRNGIIEAAENYLLNSNEEKIIPITIIEQELISWIDDHIEVQKLIGVQPPIFVFLTIYGVKDYQYSSRQIFGSFYPIDRDLLLLPEIIIDNLNTNSVEIGKLLRPCFDSLWNTVGLSKSPNYNEQGNWQRSSTYWD